MKTKDYLDELAHVLGAAVVDRDYERLSQEEALALGFGAMWGIGIATILLTKSTEIDKDPLSGAVELISTMAADFPDHRAKALSDPIARAKCAVLVNYDSEGQIAATEAIDVTPCPYAGKTATVSRGTLAGKRIEVEDWAYRTFSSFEWETMTDNPAVLVYLTEHDFEVSTDAHPYYRTALCGKIDGLSHIVRLDELEFDE